MTLRRKPFSAGRRRFLRISAGAGLSALPSFAWSAPRLHVQRAILLGAEAEIRLYHPDSAAAGAALNACVAEVERLESIFSLERGNSAISRLNAAGRFRNPPPELVTLLRTASEFSRATGGAFDVTVQPLWELYAAHFGNEAAQPSGPAPARISAALARVDYRQVVAEDDRIAFHNRGMSVTLNGIAQGFITDRVAEILRHRGFGRVLVNMGETRALGCRPDGQPWRIGIADPQQPWRVMQTLDLVEKAVATSGAYGTRFDATGRHHHLFDPRTGLSARHYRSVSVLAPTATMADALSTGLSILPWDEARRVLARHEGVDGIFVDAAGERHIHTSLTAQAGAPARPLNGK